MRGAIAAGHPLTAEAGADVLRAGGNAVDAAVAAGLASWVVESPLTGPGGGGFMLVHLARDGKTRLFDFFVTVPGLGRKERAPEMAAVDVDFAGTVQVFRIGAGSCAVPGATLGLETAHRAFGSLSWKELFGPAVELARKGFELTQAQAYLHAILDLILRDTGEGRRLYGRDQRLVAGDRLALPDLADTLERFAERGAKDFFTGEISREIVRHADSISRRDLADYRVVRRRPVRARFRGLDFRSNPPPSSGGLLIAYGLQLLDRRGLGGPPGSAEAIARLVEAMRAQNRARDEGFARGLRRGGLAKRLLEGVGGTTHISVVDGDGNAAALSITTGSGSGVILPGTGIHLNNMLGEFDLADIGRPGERMTSMMAPSLLLDGDVLRLVLGSAGSLRLRGAIFQVIVNAVGHELGVRDAIERPRVHLEEPDVHCEGGTEPAAMDALEAMGHEVTRWRRPNLYFGGVAAVGAGTDGALEAGGDPRRGGHGIVIE